MGFKSKRYKLRRLFSLIFLKHKKPVRKGIVYVLTNDSIPEMVKIGRTCRSIEERIKELSASTSVPTPFKLHFMVRSKDCFALEKKIHDTLKPYRVNSSREFFKLSPKQAKAVLQKLSGEPPYMVKAVVFILALLMLSNLLFLLF